MHREKTAMQHIGHALWVAFLVFTFVSGLVQTVWPITRMISSGFMRNVVDPLLTWLWQQPRLAGELVVMLSLTMALTALWLARYALLALSEEAWARLEQAWNRATGKRRPKRSPHVFDAPVPERHGHVIDATQRVRSLGEYTAHG